MTDEHPSMIAQRDAAAAPGLRDQVRQLEANLRDVVAEREALAAQLAVLRSTDPLGRYPGCSRADLAVALANVSGALADAEMVVPAEPHRYGAAVVELGRSRDAWKRAHERVLRLYEATASRASAGSPEVPREGRDETVPPPGWQAPWSHYGCPPHQPVGVIKGKAERHQYVDVAEAWAIYDREHGSAPEPASVLPVAPPEDRSEPPPTYEVFPVHRESGPTIWQVRILPDPCPKKREQAIAVCWAHRDAVRGTPTRGADAAGPERGTEGGEPDFRALLTRARYHVSAEQWGELRLEIERALSGAPAAAREPAQDEGEPEWVVNDIAELGVCVGGRFYFLYKGHSLEYDDVNHDDGRGVMMWRPVGKREFGECCHPLHLQVLPDRYTEGEDWQPLPRGAAREPSEAESKVHASTVAALPTAEEARAAARRHRDLVMAVAPRPTRDESVPPPGWHRVEDEFTAEMGPGAERYQADCDTLADAWAIYDREHGYAPGEHAECDEQGDSLMSTQKHVLPRLVLRTDGLFELRSRDDVQVFVYDDITAAGEGLLDEFCSEARISKSVAPRPTRDESGEAVAQAALRQLIDAVTRACDWGDGTRVANAIDAAEAYLAGNTAPGEHAAASAEPRCMYCDGNGTRYGSDVCAACEGTGTATDLHALLGELEATCRAWEGGRDEDPCQSIRELIGRFRKPGAPPEPSPTEEQK